MLENVHVYVRISKMYNKYYSIEPELAPHVLLLAYMTYVVIYYIRSATFGATCTMCMPVAIQMYGCLCVHEVYQLCILSKDMQLMKGSVDQFKRQPVILSALGVDIRIT